MTDMENKDTQNEEAAEAPQAEEVREPVEDGFTEPPEASAEPLEPVEPPEEPAPSGPPSWQDISSGQTAPVPPPQPPQAPPPPVWPGQTPPAPYYGQPPYGGYPYYGYGPQPGAQPPQTPVQPAPAQAPVSPYPAGYYGGYYQPPYGAAYPPPPEPPRKKKKPLGLKILLWIVSILAVGSLIGFGVYLAVEWDRSAHDSLLPPITDRFELPSQPENPPEEEGPAPEESEPPQDEEEKPSDLPNVDVTPNTEGIQISPRPEGEPLEPEDVYDQVVKSTVAIEATLTRDGQTAQSRGSGIIATADGYMITNAHVVLNSKNARVKVATYDGQEYDAVVVGVDRTTDLAVVKTNDHGFTPAVFGGADALSMGEWVMALGNPGGSKYANSLTRGIVSGLNREVGQYSVGGMTYIQTDAAINPGNSGGPLVNMYGQVVGINSSKIITENYEGMGFAIPVSEAQPIINELLSGGYIKGRTRLGIMIREIGGETAMMYQVPAGLQITQINEDSAFTGTEAQVGDIITALDGEAVATLRDVSNLLTGYAPGDEVTVTLYRPADSSADGDQEITVTVTLLEDKGETQE